MSGPREPCWNCEGSGRCPECQGRGCLECAGEGVCAICEGSGLDDGPVDDDGSEDDDGPEDEDRWLR